MQLSVLAYTLGNLWRRLVLPTRIDTWSLTSLQQRLVKTGERLVKHACYYWLLLAESHLWVANYYSARNPLRLSSLVILGVVARMFRCATRSSCWCT